jgi:uncharacterized surface protein with fasciclin (FAS1) repeats
LTAAELQRVAGRARTKTGKDDLMTSMHRRGFLALGSLAAGSLAAPAALRAQSLTNIADTMAGDTRFTRFLDIITRATLVEDFKEAGPITVFAPVDQAFLNAPAGILQDLLQIGQSRGGQTGGDASERNRWVALINYHVVPGVFEPSQISGADRRLRTKNGADIQISGSPGSMQISNPAPAQQVGGFGAFGAQANATPASVLGQPTRATNGIIYPINQILWP